MITTSLQELIKQELLLRQEAQQELSSRKERIIALIAEYCEADDQEFLSREEWQDFCYQKLYNKSCHTNIPFSTYLNQLMPELGYPLGYAHTKLSVYRGLKWKAAP